MNKELIAELRATFRPYWVTAESGGINLAVDYYDQAKNDAAFSKFFKYFPEIDASDGLDSIPKEIVDTWDDSTKELMRKLNNEQKLSDALTDAIGEFFHRGKLQPGLYELENYHRSYAENGQIQLDADEGKPIVIPDPAKISFLVREEHLKLLRHLNIRYGIILMDAKRPYGDRTYYYLDMADALGETFPSDKKAVPPTIIERYRKLHGEMLFATQAFWQFASYP